MSTPLSLTFLGTGTSQGVPVIGCSCYTCLSADPRDKRLRVASLLNYQGRNLLIDCGPDIRQQLLRAGTSHLDALLITHEHNDHIIGLDDLRPFIFAQGRPFIIYAEPRVQVEIKARFAYAFATIAYPGAPRFELRDLVPAQPLHLPGFPPILPIRVLHGELGILGFRIGQLAYLTDVKELPPESLRELQGLDVLVTSALHEYEHHSHMNIAEAQAFAKTLSAGNTYFLHMSHHAPPHHVLERQLAPSVHLAYDNLMISARS